jgi:hypothetical protein
VVRLANDEATGDVDKHALLNQFYKIRRSLLRVKATNSSSNNIKQRYVTDNIAAQRSGTRDRGAYSWLAGRAYICDRRATGCAASAADRP